MKKKIVKHHNFYLAVSGAQLVLNSGQERWTDVSIEFHFHVADLIAPAELDPLSQLEPKTDFMDTV